jgi:hypothetical protein
MDFTSVARKEYLIDGLSRGDVENEWVNKRVNVKATL